MNSGDQLKVYLSQHKNYCQNDARAYLWAKCQSGFKDSGIGGGNFTVPLITFAFLDLLANINAFIKKEEKYSDKDIEEIKERIKSAGLKNKVNPPRIRQFKKRTGELVKILLDDTSQVTKMSSTDVTELWNVRNKLAHKFNPQYYNALAFDPPSEGVPYEKYVLQCECAHPLFIDKSENKNRTLNVHAFNFKVIQIADFVIAKINSIEVTIHNEIIDWLNS